MGVNLGAINSKLNAYAKSSVGKACMAETIQNYIRDENWSVTRSGKTQAGDRIITQQEMRDVARELIFYIKQFAADCDLPASVMEHIESFDISTASESEGFYYVGISMEDNPKRESVQPEKYDGVHNIVALFNTGYSASGRIYGYWRTADAEIWTLKNREGLNFMQRAIDRFNSTYAEEYNVTVFLSSEYE